MSLTNYAQRLPVYAVAVSGGLLVGLSTRLPSESILAPAQPGNCV